MLLTAAVSAGSSAGSDDTQLHLRTALVNIRQHKVNYVNTRQHTSTYVTILLRLPVKQQVKPVYHVLWIKTVRTAPVRPKLAISGKCERRPRKATALEGVKYRRWNKAIPFQARNATKLGLPACIGAFPTRGNFFFQFREREGTCSE